MYYYNYVPYYLPFQMDTYIYRSAQSANVYNCYPIYFDNSYNSGYYERYNSTLNRYDIISLQNNANTHWKDWYLDIDGNSGKLILWDRPGSGNRWRVINHGNNVVSLQNTANTPWKNWYLDIDSHSGKVILWDRLSGGGYWKLTDQGHGLVSLQNTENTPWKDWYLDINGHTGEIILEKNLGSGGYWKITDHGNDTDGPSSQDCSVTGGKGKKLDSGKIGIGNVLDLEYIIYECAIEVKPGIAGINTGGTYTLSATQKGVSAIWPIVPEASRYVFSVYVENKTLWVDLEMQHRTLQGGIPPKFVWRKTWGAKTEVGSWASLKF
ncbi:TPA: hypothetical protein QCX65_001505 [Bacillus mycoides]|nr:hypothetical protein [Bacillus mycoides]